MNKDLLDKLIEAYLLIDGVIAEQEDRMGRGTDQKEQTVTAQKVFFLEEAASRIKFAING